jgi:hypothetical protein
MPLALWRQQEREPERPWEDVLVVVSAVEEQREYALEDTLAIV